MTTFDTQYIDLCERIIRDGVRASNRTGTDTLKLFGQTLRFDVGKEFPILTSKHVAWKSAILDMMWIHQAQTNDVRWLQERGVRIWNEWACDENGDYQGKSYGKEHAHTIGTAYGWVDKKYQMTQNLIETLKTDPQDRRMVISLWQNQHIPSAVLPTCVWNTQWCVTGDKLNVTVTQRSADVPLGLPFDVTAHAMMLMMIAQVTGFKPGEMLWVINDAHIYVNQLDGINEQIAKYKEVGCPPAPKVWLNPEIKDFFEFDNSRELKDIKLENYEYNMKIKMPVSV